MSWQTTANDRLSDYKENAMKKMSATTSRSGGNDVEARARKEKNTELSTTFFSEDLFKGKEFWIEDLEKFRKWLAQL